MMEESQNGELGAGSADSLRSFCDFLCSFFALEVFMKVYAGIGSRKTPRNILSLMTKSARRLDELGWTLRSGGALGADLAFEMGAGRKEIYLPWRNFNKNPSPLHRIDELAYAVARRYHPAWDRCTPAARKFHARNCYQILGRDLATPADFVLCWTPDGKVTGGTGQALRIAADYNVPVINMFNSDWGQQVAELLDGISGEAEQELDQANEQHIADWFGDAGQRI